MSPTLTVIVVIGASVLSAIAGLIWVRRLVPLSFRHTHHEVAGFFISLIAALEQPFAGLVRITPEPFMETLESLRLAPSPVARHPLTSRYVNASSNALASWRSAVSKPSVNQP